MKPVGGAWQWITNEPFVYAPFGPTSRNVGWIPQDNEDQYLRFSYDGLWLASNGLETRFFIVEIESETPSTPTQTATPVLVPSSTPTPTAVPLFHHELDKGSLELNSMVAAPPGGLSIGSVAFTAIPEDGSADGMGMAIDLAPGQGVFALSLVPVNAETMVRIISRFQTVDPGVSAALVALNYPIDGQFAYINVTNAALPVEAYRDVELLYKPPSGQLLVGIQAVNASNAVESTSVYVDELKVENIGLKADDSIALQVDGSFDGNLTDLIVNINNDTGTVSPFFESFDDVAIRLSVDADDNAANAGTIANLVTPALYPLPILSGVSVQREAMTGGGMFAMVVTNGFQNMGVFRSIGEFPTAELEPLQVGGRFDVANPDIPITVVLQNGGTGVESSLIVDDLGLTEY